MSRTDVRTDRPAILVFVDWYYPGYRAGGPIRSVYNLVVRLRSRADFHVITRDTDYLASVPYPSIVPDTWTTIGEGHHVWYCSSNRARARDFLAASSAHTRWDAVYVNGVFSPRFSMVPMRLCNSGRIASARTVLAPRGMLAPDALRIRAYRKRMFLTLAAVIGLYEKALWHVTNPVEEGQVRRRFPRARTRVIPNLVDSSVLVQGRQIRKSAGEIRLVSVARIAPEKNLIFVLRVLRTVRSRVDLDVFGSVYDEDYLARCRNACADLPRNVQVRFRGPVSHDDLPRTLDGYHAMILPTLGENFGHVVGESVMAGLPVIVSDRTPWNDLATAGGGVVLPLEDPARWSESVDALGAMEQLAYDAMWMRTLAYARARADDAKHVEAYVEMFEIPGMT